jgi:hypothetical protein
MNPNHKRSQNKNQNVKQKKDDDATTVVVQERVSTSVKETAAVETLTTSSVISKTNVQIERAAAVLARTESELLSPRRGGDQCTPRQGTPRQTLSSTTVSTEQNAFAAAEFRQSSQSEARVFSSSSGCSPLNPVSAEEVPVEGLNLGGAAAAVDILRKRISELEAECNFKSQENSELLYKLDDIISVLETMSAQKSEDDAIRAELEHEVSLLSDNLSAANGELVLLTDQLQALRSELQSESEQHALAVGVLKATHEATEEMHAKRYSEAEARHETIVANVQRAASEAAAELEQQVAASREQCSAAEREVAAARQQVEEVRAAAAVEIAMAASRQIVLETKRVTFLAGDTTLTEASHKDFHDSDRTKVMHSSATQHNVVHEHESWDRQSEPSFSAAAFVLTALVVPALAVQLASVAWMAKSSRGASLAGVIAAFAAPRLSSRHDCAVILGCASLAMAVSVIAVFVPLPTLPQELVTAAVALIALSVSTTVQAAPSVVLRAVPTLSYSWACGWIVELLVVGGAVAAFALPTAATQRGQDAVLSFSVAAGVTGSLAAFLLFSLLHHREEPPTPTAYKIPLNVLFRKFPFLVSSTAAVAALVLIELGAQSGTIRSDLPMALLLCAVMLAFAVAQRRPASDIPLSICLSGLMLVAATLLTQGQPLLYGSALGGGLGLCIRRIGECPSAMKLVIGLSLLVTTVGMISANSGVVSQSDFTVALAALSALLFAANAVTFKSFQEEDAADGSYTTVE